MIKNQCPKFYTCSAALCPLDPHPRRYWYSDTEICNKRGNVPKWLKTQQKISKVNPDPHSYYTQKMLESIKTVRADISGLSCIGYDERLEFEWLQRREDRHSQSMTYLKVGGNMGFRGVNINGEASKRPGKGLNTLNAK